MISSLLHNYLESYPISVVDVGAAQFNSTKDRYKKLLDYPGTQVIGFEANPEEYKKLSDNMDKRIKYLPYALADGNPHTLKVCRLAGCSSILEPNVHLASNYPAFGEYMEVVERIDIETMRLDDVTNVVGMDFLKLDTQGSELMILENSEEKLKNTLVIECEVEFIPQYSNQPLFSEIEKFLRGVGFMFHSFLGYGSRLIKPYPVGDNPIEPGGQWLWSDAIFVRDISSWHGLSVERLAKLAVIMSDIYHQKDYAYRALLLLDKKTGSNIAEDYIEQAIN